VGGPQVAARLMGRDEDDVARMDGEAELSVKDEDLIGTQRPSAVENRSVVLREASVPTLKRKPFGANKRKRKKKRGGVRSPITRKGNRLTIGNDGKEVEHSDVEEEDAIGTQQPPPDVNEGEGNNAAQMHSEEDDQDCDDADATQVDSEKEEAMSNEKVKFPGTHSAAFTEHMASLDALQQSMLRELDKQRPTYIYELARGESLTYQQQRTLTCKELTPDGFREMWDAVMKWRQSKGLEVDLDHETSTRKIVFLDIGSGIGQLVAVASVVTHAEAWGVEIRDDLHDHALKWLSKKNTHVPLLQNAMGSIESRLLHGDVTHSRFEQLHRVMAEADVVFCNNVLFGDGLPVATLAEIFQARVTRHGACLVLTEPLTRPKTPSSSSSRQPCLKFEESFKLSPGCSAWCGSGQNVHLYTVNK